MRLSREVVVGLGGWLRILISIFRGRLMILIINNQGNIIID